MLFSITRLYTFGHSSAFLSGALERRPLPDAFGMQTIRRIHDGACRLWSGMPNASGSGRRSSAPDKKAELCPKVYSRVNREEHTVAAIRSISFVEDAGARLRSLERDSRDKVAKPHTLESGPYHAQQCLKDLFEEERLLVKCASGSANWSHTSRLRFVVGASGGRRI